MVLVARTGARPQYGRKRHIRPDGYVRVWVPGHPIANSDGYAQEHRYLLYEAGVTVPKGWHVHHLNEDKADNRLDNLVVMKAATHTLTHLLASGVVNQYGRFPVMTPAERKEKNRLRCCEAARIRSGYYDRHPDAVPVYLPKWERHYGRRFCP